MPENPTITVKFIGGPLAGDYETSIEANEQRPDTLLLWAEDRQRLLRYDRDPADPLTFQYVESY